jgi:hypothetical protein
MYCGLGLRILIPELGFVHEEDAKRNLKLQRGD